MIAQSLSGTPGPYQRHGDVDEAFSRGVSAGELAPGDVLITNDPWQTAGQINDITITTPIFRNGKMVALFANTCHSADIGGRILSAEAREVFEEGLRIPIMKLFDGGEPNEDVHADHAHQRAPARRGRSATSTPRRRATTPAGARCWK